MIIIPINTHYWFIREVHESWGRNQRQSSCLTLPHYAKPNPNLKQNWVILWLFQPITQLCRNAHYKNTSKTHHYFIIKVHEFCHMFCNRIQLCSWLKQPQTYSILLQNVGAGTWVLVQIVIGCTQGACGFGNSLDQIRTGALLPKPLSWGSAVSHGTVC